MGSEVCVEGNLGATFQGGDEITERGRRGHHDPQGSGDFDEIIVAALEFLQSWIARPGSA
jgi:hypothetical protein